MSRQHGVREVAGTRPSVRMFESDFLESFSHIHPVTPLVIYTPIVAGCLYGAHARALPGVVLLALLGLGLLSWTFAEYALHRYVFHYEPRTAWGTRLHFLIHGVHHDDPDDATRLVMAPPISVPLALVFFGVFRTMLGPALSLPAFAGFVSGYVTYDTLHYSIHHFRMRGRVGRLIKSHHLSHHFRDDRRGFGVSSPVWDYVFRTLPL